VVVEKPDDDESEEQSNKEKKNSAEKDPWMHDVSASKSEDVQQILNARETTCKVDIAQCIFPMIRYPFDYLYKS